MNTKKSAAAALVAALGVTTLAACGGSGDTTADAPAPKTVRLVSHDSFNASEEVLAEFERKTGFTIEVVKSGDAGEAVNKEILTKGNPQGDVFFGVDNTLLSRALDNGIFVPYEAKGLDRVPAALRTDAKHRVTPSTPATSASTTTRSTSPTRSSTRRRPSTTSRSRRTRTCSSSRTRSVPPRASASSSARQPDTATTGGRTTGPGSRPTA